MREKKQERVLNVGNQLKLLIWKVVEFSRDPHKINRDFCLAG